MPKPSWDPTTSPRITCGTFVSAWTYMEEEPAEFALERSEKGIGRIIRSKRRPETYFHTEVSIIRSIPQISRISTNI